jgi:glyoxalase family protein
MGPGGARSFTSPFNPIAARPGAGGVHHVAFRTPDEAQYHAWTKHLTDLRVPNSGEIDRFYFRSL